MADDLGAVSDLQLLERMRARANDGWSLAVWLLVPAATIPAGAVYGESVALAPGGAGLPASVTMEP